MDLDIIGSTHSPSPAPVEEPDTEYAGLLRGLGDKAHLLVNSLPGKLPQSDVFERERSVFAQELLDVTKAIFTTSVSEDARSIKHISAFLESIGPSKDAPTTRSGASAKKSQIIESEPKPLQPTPISELYTGSKITPKAVWDQLDLKGSWLSQVASAVVSMEKDLLGEDDMALNDQDSDNQEEEQHEEEEETEEVPLGPEYETYLNDETVETNKKKRKRSLLEDEVEDEDVSSRIPILKEKKNSKSQFKSPVDDNFFSLSNFHRETDAGERDFQNGGDFGIDLFAPILNEKVKEPDAAQIKFDDFFGGGGATERAKSATPDDKKDEQPQKNGKKRVSFSSVVKVKPIQPRPNAGETEILRLLINKFGIPKMRALLTKEKGNIAKLSELLGPEDWPAEADEESDKSDTEEEEDEIDNLDIDGVDLNDDDLGDSDMEEWNQEGGDMIGSNEDDLSEDEDDQEKEGQVLRLSENGPSSKGGTATMRRITKDLFDGEGSEDEDEDDNSKWSKNESRLRMLNQQIQSLEEENVAQKDWMLRGEVRSKERPVNSLLEQNLEFEHINKVVPVVTQERTEGLEDMIKRRILEGSFDDVVRKHAYDPSAFLPSRFFELENTQSQKSLAEVYEDQFSKESAAVSDPHFKKNGAVDEQTQKQHQEIEKLFEQLSNKLDALSNARFTPKTLNTTITTISNLPSIAMESALPTATSASTLLAPEEIYTGKDSSSKEMLTSAQKKTHRQKKRKERKAIAERIERAKQKRGGGGKKEMMEKLVGRKGVTVIGKDKRIKNKSAVKPKD